MFNYRYIKTKLTVGISKIRSLSDVINENVLYLPFFENLLIDVCDKPLQGLKNPVKAAGNGLLRVYPAKGPV